MNTDYFGSLWKGPVPTYLRNTRLSHDIAHRDVCQDSLNIAKTYSCTDKYWSGPNNPAKFPPDLEIPPARF